jgi:hypothetical protein
VAGATEDSAQASAEGQVQNLKYEATYPLLLNVAGQPTYFMALKDNAGLVKMYAMINVEHYQSVATGSTVASTQESYLQMLASSGALSEDEVAANGVEDQLSGTIASIAQAVIDGSSHFYVTLEGDGAIYDFALPEMLGIVRYRVGDAIEFGCATSSDDEEEGTVRQVVSLAGVRANSEAAPVAEPSAEASDAEADGPTA